MRSHKVEVRFSFFMHSWKKDRVFGKGIKSKIAFLMKIKLCRNKIYFDCLEISTQHISNMFCVSNKETPILIEIDMKIRKRVEVN